MTMDRSLTITYLYITHSTCDTTVFSTRSSVISNKYSKTPVNLYLRDVMNEFGEEMLLFLKLIYLLKRVGRGNLKFHLMHTSDNNIKILLASL